MLLCKFQLGELPEGDKNSIMEQLDSAERIAMEERLESSYRQIREYQDTLYQAGDTGERDEADSPEVRHGLCEAGGQAGGTKTVLRMCKILCKYDSPSKNASKLEQQAMHEVS